MGDNPPYIPGKPCSKCSSIKDYGKKFSSCQNKLCGQCSVYISIK